MTFSAKMFDTAKRPLLIFGWGIHLAGAEHIAKQFSRLTGIPAVCTWGAADLFDHDDPLYAGVFGTHGVRAANFAVQNADVILSIGSRLDTKATGTPASAFAPKAKIFMVDIDQAEIDKFKKLGREVLGIRKDLKDFLWNNMPKKDFEWESYPNDPDYSEWVAKIKDWKEKYPPGCEEGGLNPYKFVEELSGHLTKDDVIVADTGCSLGWMMQAFKFKGQRFIHAFNQTPMGYGLPAAIGAAFASGKRVVLITGDGGLAVNITEFATLARHRLPIKIILFNNRGHAMCRQTQRTWLGGTYPSTSYEGGLATPDYEEVAKGYGIPTHCSPGALFGQVGPGFLNLEIPLDYQIVPQVRFGKNLEDADPALPKEELEGIMA